MYEDVSTYLRMPPSRSTVWPGRFLSAKKVFWKTVSVWQGENRETSTNLGVENLACGLVNPEILVDQGAVFLRQVAVCEADDVSHEWCWSWFVPSRGLL